MVHLNSVYPCEIIFLKKKKMLLIAATFALFMCKINPVIGDGTILRIDKDINSLDYVSLTDHSRNKYTSDLSATAEGNTTWVIGKTSCLNLQPGCMCDFQNSIICSCDENDQVVNLKGTQKASFSVNETWKWKINGCSKIILQPNFLSAFFESDSGLHLEFNNNSKLIIQESAFTLKDSGSFSHATTVLFNNCTIENVPPRSFPSYLSTVRFVNCKIGTLSSHFIQSLKMDKIIFENTSVDDVQSNAFYSNTILDSLIAKNSRFKQIRPDAVASAIQQLNFSDCVIDNVKKHGLSGHIASVVFEGCTINNLEAQGFSVKAWTMISFVNNTFENVSRLGIDLSNVESKIVRPAQLVGNTWRNVDTNFITTGTLEEPFASVQNNTFLTFCSCGTTFTSFLTLNGSRSWFHDELFQSSKCLMDEKGRLCMLQSENNTEDGFISYQELPLLCSPEVFMCMSEVKDIPVNPQLPDRLRILAFLIGAFALFMVVSLLLTLLVYMIRRKSPRKSENHPNELTNDLPRKEFVKSLNNDPYGAMTHKLPKTPSMPLRVALLEDVEMEDKGVQTLPTELSADIIEGLREKLSKPDSFWDAKETIDHLYDLIHVRDQSASASSPPDVTVCNENNSEIPASSNSSAHNISHDSLKLLVSSPSRRPPKILPFDKSPRRSMSTFAQIPSPSKSAPICEYRDPSDSQTHIYSELGSCAEPKGGKSPSEFSPSKKRNQGVSQQSPVVCDYTEPRDFQTHIYAELSNPYGSSSPSKASYTQTTNFNSAMTDIPIINKEVPTLPMQIPMPSSVIPSSSSSSSPQKNFDSTKMNDLNSPTSEYKPFPFEAYTPGTSICRSNSSGSASTLSSNIPTQTGATNFSQTKRPLPSIPSFSAVQ